MKKWLLLGVLLAGCLADKDPEDETDGESSEGMNIQYDAFLEAVSETGLFRNSGICEEPEGRIGLERDGSTVRVDYSNQPVDDPLFKIVDEYGILADKGFPLGTWEFKRGIMPGYSRMDAGRREQADSLLEKHNFIYQGENVSIRRDRIRYGYPHVWIYPIKNYEASNLQAPGVSVKYLGRDSAEITTRDGEHIRLRFLPFQSFRAYAKGRPDISIALDSCNAIGKALAETWMDEVLRPGD